MSAPLKKRSVEMKGNSSDDSDNYSSENEEGEEYTGQEEIQVDFEGRSPIDSDFHGIKQLLQQLFLKAHVNLSELTELLISQNTVGSVVKQSDTDEIDGDADDDEDDDPNDVFGVTSIVNLTDKQSVECVSQLRTLLSELCAEHGTERCNTLVQSLLKDDTKPLGLIINERFVNIPPQIAVPLLQSLSKEIRKACEKKLPFDFAYYAFICKLHKVDGKVQSKKKGKNTVPEDQVIWSNPEEEIIDQEADFRFEFCVKNESDSGLGGHWLEEDVAMTPYRRVLLLSADKLEPTINRIQESLAQ
ncbi:hypothetical protein AAG570_009414 [Ranatra chinensis]|uniref:Protein BCCIP homolog n=1 Tax=Ranatra chinensis TaxID=642074 RepID=A0ABD0YP08_9HEMI